MNRPWKGIDQKTIMRLSYVTFNIPSKNTKSGKFKNIL